MNRRRAILGLSLLGIGAAFTYTGIRFYKLNRKPKTELLEKYSALISDLAELIIPRTDTPGAKDAKVGPFIEKMIRECTDLKSQNNFIEGLESIAADAQSRFGKPFTQCSEKQQAELLARYENGNANSNAFWAKVERRLTGSSFFETLKKYTVLGYCTSQPGATQGLSYDYIPGTYEVNLPLSPGQRAWATQ
mgnify:CR=1 FL=1